MHILTRIRPSQDPWQKVACLSLQQLTEDVSMNQKRVRALEESVMALSDALGRSGFLGPQDTADATAALDHLREEVCAWSRQSLDRTEELVLAIQQLVSCQRADDDGLAPAERLAS